MQSDITSINALILFGLNDQDRCKISDGHHTFEELYHHRTLLFIIFVKNLLLEYKQTEDLSTTTPIWWTKKYSSGNDIQEGWFMLGIGIEKGEQISYHVSDKYLHLVENDVPKLIIAPTFDGHTSKDVAERLENLIKNNIK